MADDAGSASFLDVAALQLTKGLDTYKLLLIPAAAVAVLFLARLARGFSSFWRIKSALSSIPSAPGENWLLGHVLPMLNCVKRGKAAWDMMEEWINGAGQGKIVKYRILNTQGVAVSDPLALKRVFQTGYKLYEKDLKLSYHPFLPILGTGLVTADGDLWQKQRLLIGPALRTDLLDMIIPIAKNGIDRLSEKLQKHKGSGKPVDIEEEFRLLTLQIIGDAVLSMAPDECDKVFPALYLPVMEEANQRVLRPHRKYLPTPSWFQFRSRMNKLNDFLINYFRQRWSARQAGEKRVRPDILDRILDSIEESGAKWDAALEQQMCYEIKTFLLAGHETSAAMLTWSIYELSQSEEATAKVRAEADAVFGAAEAEPPRRAVDGMVYTLSVLKEALRKYSVVPVVTRILAKDDELMGHTVPAGTMIACILQGTHNLYKQPAKFSPERFMPGGEFDQFDESIRAYMFVPFIQGPRNCLGQHFALLEARVLLSLLIKRFKWKAAHGPKQGERSPTVIPVGPIKGMEMYIN
mmetsp:Transcript_27719/g.60701  ORF Transcript_27719/g.60701 Transcript_27719/m.60701 type:complete len:523 (-) Transcript_27719:909-2477(-)|eukprot:CAMPEP_0202920854 /NCGR_PEP_ID=MMETSP1392-20130828/77073_1 /ASSEMBLY_ACC=CAM_ASM_000868 /TAXON_ID=225041 /ORGANISM="Chlamydomonas chlamydogama, Strain SAG 11-48b" /LENGTH=522 /DNA_ID=CAMNT_0049614369 /DNA_START=204 /DNA_END=1772 /DNA_ORIENTATION=-